MDGNQQSVRGKNGFLVPKVPAKYDHKSSLHPSKNNATMSRKELDDVVTFSHSHATTAAMARRIFASNSFSQNGVWCRACNAFMDIKLPSQILFHAAEEHLTSIFYQCSLCGYRCKKKADIVNHDLENHSDDQSINKLLIVFDPDKMANVLLACFDDPGEIEVLKKKPNVSHSKDNLSTKVSKQTKLVGSDQFPERAKKRMSDEWKIVSPVSAPILKLIRVRGSAGAPADAPLVKKQKIDMKKMIIEHLRNRPVLSLMRESKSSELIETDQSIVSDGSNFINSTEMPNTDLVWEKIINRLDEGDKPLRCFICQDLDHFSKSKCVAIKHALHHMKRDFFMCICTEDFSKKSELVDHVQRFHDHTASEQTVMQDCVRLIKKLDTNIAETLSGCLLNENDLEQTMVTTDLTILNKAIPLATATFADYTSINNRLRLDNQNTQLKKRDIIQWPKFDNHSKTVCYSNSALQALFALKNFEESCSAFANGSPIQVAIFRFLQEYRSRKIEVDQRLFTASVRNALGHPFLLEDGQQCAFEFIRQLLNGLDLNHLFEVQVNIMHRCKQCGFFEERARDLLNFVMLTVGGSNDFADMLRSWGSVEGQTCSYCGNGDAMESADIIENTKDQVIVYVARHLGGEQSVFDNSAIANFDPDRVFISENRMKVVAAILHFGTINGGHYVATVRSTKYGWLYCDDHKITTLQSFPAELKNVSLLFLEKA